LTVGGLLRSAPRSSRTSSVKWYVPGARQQMASLPPHRRHGIEIRIVRASRRQLQLVLDELVRVADADVSEAVGNGRQVGPARLPVEQHHGGVVEIGAGEPTSSKPSRSISAAAAAPNPTLVNRPG